MWSWSHGSWIYNYLCNQCLSPLMLWVRIRLRRGILNTTLCDKVCQWLSAGRWFSPVSSTNKTDHHDITEILLKVALNTITLTLKLSTLGKICTYTYPDHSWDYNIYSIRRFTFMNDFIFIIICEQFGFLLQNKIWIISNMEKLGITVTKNVNKTKTILKVPSYFRRHMSQSFLCSMIWGEGWSFVLLILVELLTITVQTIFS